MPPPSSSPPPSGDKRPVGSVSVRMAGGFWEKAGGWVLPRDARGEGYWQVASNHTPQIGFCLLFVFASSWGQTFLLSIFQPHWMQVLAIDPGEMGLLYGGATLASGLLLPMAGRWLDRVEPRRAALVTLAGLTAFSLFIATVSQVWMLALALFGLRFFGQGLSSNVGMTHAARWFSHNRGKAVSLAGLGFPLGEAVLPALVTFGILAMGWRWTWALLAGVCVLVFLPLVLSLTARNLTVAPEEELSAAKAGSRKAPVTRGDLLRDWRFYAMLGTMIPLPFIATGMIFFQAVIAEQRGWGPGVFATGFLIFAVIRAACSLTTGAWVDRLGAVSLLAVPSFALALGLACLLRPEPAWAYAFFIGMAVSFGSSGAITTAAWSEMFGTASIGTIRGLSGAVAVFVTAAAPMVFGLALNLGVSIEGLVLGSAGLTLGLAWPLSIVVRRSHRVR